MKAYAVFCLILQNDSQLSYRNRINCYEGMNAVFGMLRIEKCRTKGMRVVFFNHKKYFEL